MKIKHCIFKPSGFICIIGLFLITATLFSCANSSNDDTTKTQNKKATFFGPISCGDNLEKCIQNGWVQHTGGETAWLSYDWELTDSNITSLFPRAGVVFDNKNIIHEIHLISTNHSYVDPKDDTEGAFNYMLQLCCQQYQGMQQSDFHKSTDHCLYDEGIEYFWETQNLVIKLRHYKTKHNENKCNHTFGPGFCVNDHMSAGTYTEVIITGK